MKRNSQGALNKTRITVIPVKADRASRKWRVGAAEMTTNTGIGS